jgi:hypothetical protein
VSTTEPDPLRYAVGRFIGVLIMTTGDAEAVRRAATAVVQALTTDRLDTALRAAAMRKEMSLEHALLALALSLSCIYSPAEVTSALAWWIAPERHLEELEAYYKDVMLFRILTEPVGQC